MKESLCLNEKFTFHSLWISAMSHIASKAVRNRLMTSIIEYGLNSRHVPVGNSTADAILSFVMDQIDHESGRKTRQEEYAECVRSFREQEAAKLDEQPGEDCCEYYNEDEYDDCVIGNADDSSDVAGHSDVVSEQKSSEDCLPLSVAVGDGGAVGELRFGRIAKCQPYLPVKHKNKSRPKKRGLRSRRRRHR